jgi:hypothetical protein
VPDHAAGPQDAPSDRKHRHRSRRSRSRDRDHGSSKGRHARSHSSASSSSSSSSSERRSRRHHKSGKRAPSKSEALAAKQAVVAALRAERLAREHSEQARAQALFPMRYALVSLYV